VPLGPQAAFIGDGAVFDRAAAYESFDPSTATPLTSVHECSLADVGRAVEAAAQAADEWGGTALTLRQAVLRRTADLLAAERDHLVNLAVRDVGATIRTAGALQVDPAIARLRWWAAQPPAALCRPAVPSPQFDCEIELVPVGVVACISPYNFPLLSMVGKVAPALFSGNAAIMKPAPQDPLLVGRLAIALRTALAEVGAPVELVALVTGQAPELGAELVRHPDVGSVSFTGSTAVGRQIGESCGARFKPAVLELGGKGALIAREDADVAAVVAALRETWTIQAGQRCRTPARLLAHPSVHDEIVDRLSNDLRALVVANAADPHTDVGPVISARHTEVVEGAVAAAVLAGREVRRTPRAPRQGWFSRPALVLGCTADDRIMQEEVFGPVVAVTTVRDDDEAVRIANATPYGLTDYVFSADVDAARAVARRLRTGGVAINTAQRYEQAPFGGVRDSGIGREGGLHSLEACTVRRATVAPSGALAVVPRDV